MEDSHIISLYQQPTQNASQQPVSDSSQRQTQDGYTMELKTAITDGQMAYIVIGITAPEDMVLNATTIEGYNPEKPSLRPGNWGPTFLTDTNGAFIHGSMQLNAMEDHDGLANTQDLVITTVLNINDEQYALSNGMV